MTAYKCALPGTKSSSEFIAGQTVTVCAGEHAGLHGHFDRFASTPGFCWVKLRSIPKPVRFKISEVL